MRFTEDVYLSYTISCAVNYGSKESSSLDGAIALYTGRVAGEGLGKPSLKRIV